jgi:hypothetical protein
LSRFIARSAEKGLPFFRVLKEAHHFQWGPEQQKAFDSLKDYLTKLTMLVKPTHNAVLMLYLAASPVAVSAVLVEEKDYENRTRQFPIYFVSEELSGAKLNYSELEKIAYTVLMRVPNAQALFPSTQNQGNLGSAIRSLIQEQRSNRQSWKMGNRVE